METFSEVLFGYCSYIWMFHSTTLKRKKNHLSESYLQIVCTDSSSLFEKLLEKENSATFHHRNIINVAIQ